MSRSSFRFVWPALCLLLVAALAGSTVYWQRQLRTATQKKKKPARPPAFDKRDAAFFRELATMQRYETKPPLEGADAARLAAYNVMELNKRMALERGGEAPTLTAREVDFRERAVFPLAATMQVQLAEPLKRYRYEIINKSDRALPAPILFRHDRWDSAKALVAQAGFTAIPDETERAIALWRFVCSHRLFGNPPTEGTEEHDVVKFFAYYGYGFCDDTARALATLAELSGLKSRVWELDGHVVAEVMANGHWRMLDADQQAYFHKPNAPAEILGVEELTADRSAFTQIVSFRNAADYPARYIDAFVKKEGNKVTTGGTAEQSIVPVLRGGETMTFTNYNWGRYFLGKYPTPPPRFYNGTFTYPVQARDLVQGNAAIIATPTEQGFRLENRSAAEITLKLPFSYPFPIVGGMIEGKPELSNGKARLTLEDEEHRRILTADLRHRIQFDLNYFVAILTSDPTHRFVLTLTLEPKAVLELKNFRVVSDFQFAQMALVPLQGGANEFHVHFPENSKPEAFELGISWE